MLFFCLLLSILLNHSARLSLSQCDCVYVCMCTSVIWKHAMTRSVHRNDVLRARIRCAHFCWCDGREKKAENTEIHIMWITVWHRFRHNSQQTEPIYAFICRVFFIFFLLHFFSIEIAGIQKRCKTKNYA